jgi:hypothetical protein
MSRKFKYVGPHDAVDIPGVGTVEHGHQVEVESDVAAGLDGQADWEHVPDPKRVKAGKKAAASNPETKES